MFGKVTYSSRRITASGSALYTPTTSEGTLPAYNGAGANVHHQLAGGQRGQPASAASSRRRPTPAATSTSSLSNSSFLSVRGGYFHDNYNDTGIPNTTNYIYQTSTRRRWPASRRAAGPDRHAEHAARADRRLATRPSAASSTPTTTTRSSAAGYHTLKAGVRLPEHGQRRQQAYPGGYVDIFWDRAFIASTGPTRVAAPTATTRSTTAACRARRARTSSRSTCRTSGRSATA